MGVLEEAVRRSNHRWSVNRERHEHENEDEATELGERVNGFAGK